MKYHVRDHEATSTTTFAPCCADCFVKGVYTIDAVRMTYEEALTFLRGVNYMTTREATAYLHMLSKRGGF